jgi:integrase
MTVKPNRAKLTKGYVDRVRPGAKDEFHWDAEVKGFGLRITPTGKITFVVQGRVDGSGKEARITIGPYGVFTVDQARDEAREHLRSMRKGIDPRDVKKADEAAKVTLAQVMEAYLARPLQLKDSTKAEMRRHVEQVMEGWKDKPIVSITTADVRKRYEEMATKGLRGKGPAPVQASIAMTTLRTLINFTMSEYKRLDGKPLIEHNPVAILRREMKPSAPRTRQIDRRKVGEVWNMLDAARVSARDADARAGVDLVRLLLLTGGRRNECAMLTWDRVNLDENDPTNCWWYLPDPKNRNPVTLPLSKQAAALLKARKPADDDKGPSPYVFPSRSKAGHVMDTRAPLEQIAKVIGMARLSAHDLRRTFVTLGVKACRLDLAKLELLTNHVPQSVTAKHYLETSDLRDYHREVQEIADFIEKEAAVAEAQATGGNVVPMPQRA